ncbi:MAG: leucine-rich repeat protein, partial [Oscillospiraceae bacterium]|nr:leucine-rich repeat protein [Oscillospiraceae bacterium]
SNNLKGWEIMKKFASKSVAILVAGLLMCSGAELLPDQISTSLTAYAYTTEDGTDGLRYRIFDDYVIVDSATEEKIWVVVPDEFQKADGTVVPVIGIADGAFQSKKTITNLVLGANVYRIGKAAFAGCTNLTTATFNEGLEEIGQEAFRGCGFEEITLPATLKEIDWGFPENPNLRSVNFLGGDELVIGGSSFAQCKALETVTMGEGVAEIGSNGFAGCSNLKIVELSSTLKTMGSYAFAYCSSLEQIKIPDSVESIGAYAFYSCDLTTVTLPEGLKTIEHEAFINNTNLTEITIPSTVETIGAQVFNGDKNLESITFLGMNTIMLYTLSLPTTTVIRGYEGSTAQAYAEKYNQKFIALDGNQDTTDSEIDPEILWGDADGNGKIEILDVVLMNRVYVGVDKISESGKQNADTDQDSKITLSDSMNVLKLLVHLLEQKDFPIVAES